MRVIIAGSRPPKEIRNDAPALLEWKRGLYRHLLIAIRESDYPITEVVSGCAEGADRIGEIWAEHNHVPVKPFPADWATLGRYLAGKVRNRAMGRYGDALIALWDGQSGGTRHMIDFMRDLGKPVHVHTFTNTRSSAESLVTADRRLGRGCVPEAVPVPPQHVPSTSCPSLPRAVHPDSGARYRRTAQRYGPAPRSGQGQSVA